MVENLATPQVSSYTRPAPHLTPRQSVAEARRLLRETRARVIPVVADEATMRLVGLVKRRSLLALSSTRTDAPVSAIAEEPSLLLSPSQPLREAIQLMLRADEWYAPVVDGSRRLLGILGLEAAMQRLLEENPPTLERPCREFMTPNPVAVGPDEPVYRVWQLMMSRNISAVPVARNGRIVGVVSEYDLLAHGYTRPALEAGAPRRGPRVAEVMHTPPVTVEPDQPLRRAVREMLERDIGRVYVASPDASLLGVIDRSDAARAWLEAA